MEMEMERKRALAIKRGIRRRTFYEKYFSMYVSDEDAAASFLNALPDDLVELILSLLPFPYVFRARSVCHRWKNIIDSKGFVYNQPSQPWYFMFTGKEVESGDVHDPNLPRWYGALKLPCIEATGWLNASSNGLVCFLDCDHRTISRVFVCNPITQTWRRIDDPPRHEYSTDIALSIYASTSSSPGYKISVVHSTSGDDFRSSELSIHVYDSRALSWHTPVKETMAVLRRAVSSVICGGVLYCLMDCPKLYSEVDTGYRVVVYDLAEGATSSLIEASIPAPRSLTCGWLMNLRERMIMVGGIKKKGWRNITEDVGVWELVEREWREISRMPRRFFKGLKGLADGFGSSGAGDVIYVHSYEAPALLLFDVESREWRWAAKSPYYPRSSLDFFDGFSFLPRIETSP